MKSFSRNATEEHMKKRLPLTRLEALAYFGVNDLTRTICRMKEEGWVIERSVVTQESVIKRMQQVIAFKPLKNTPYAELKTSEYRVVRFKK